MLTGRCYALLVELWATLSLLMLDTTSSHSLATQLSRRGAFGSAALHCCSLLPAPLVLPSWNVAVDSPTAAAPSSLLFGVGDEVVRSLVYEKILGQGTYKTVYLVSTMNDDLSKKQSFALAVQRLREKADVKDALRGIQIAQKLESILPENEQRFFEKIEGWWIQPTMSSSEFAEQRLVFPINELSRNERTQKAPSRFLGTKWLVALKPVYDIDLKAFCSKSPTLYPVGSSAEVDHPSPATSSVAGVSLSDQGAINLALDLVHAGRLMHDRAINLVHRDIKAKNVMLSHGRPVIIDYGFSYFVNKKSDGGRFCIQQPGRLKGEVRYVLAKDVAKFQACKEGDSYAMGKTLYEVLFGEAQADSAQSLKQEITVPEAEAQNKKFRKLLYSDDAGCKSRFHMSKNTRDILLAAIRGICRDLEPLSFAEAESFMLEQFADYR